MAEKEKKMEETEVQAASPDHSYAGPGDVECDFCTGRKHKAVKSCLVCVASFCETHLKPHYEDPVLKEHKLIEASGNLKEKICSKHHEVLEIYCHTDQSFICNLCLTDEHKSHDTVSVKAYRTEKQSELKEEQMKSQQRIQEKQKKVEEQKQAVNTIKLSAETAVVYSERICTELISSMEKMRLDVRKLIRAQVEAELSGAEQRLEQLEQEIADLRRRETELEQISHTNDDMNFLKETKAFLFGRRSPRLIRPDFQSDVSEESLSTAAKRHLSFDGVKKLLSDLEKTIEEFYKDKTIRIPELEPKTRDGFMKYFCDLTLDPNTVNYYLILSEKNRAVTCSERKQLYSDHPERFDSYRQVLSKESVCGRCYWEVEWSGDGGVFISVSYKHRKESGKECAFGRNNQSWSLHCSSSFLHFCHNDIVTELRAPSSSRIGVYVDHSAGTLCFYSVSDTMKLLHRVHTTFTQPLYAGFWLYSNVLCKITPTVKLCAPEQ